MTTEPVYIVDESFAAYFHPARLWLRERAYVREVLALSDIPEDTTPRAILVVQTRPGQITRGEYEATLQTFPLAAVIAFLGPLCDGEARTGRLQPGVLRVAWKYWESQLPAALEGARLPPTASEVDRLLHPPRLPVRSLPAGAVGVYATTSTAADTLADAIRGCGGTATIAPSLAPYVLRSLAAVLIDLDGSPSAAEEALRVLRESDTPVILLSAFVRPEEVAAWTGLGAAAVLAKPFPLGQLEHALSLVAQPRRRRSRASAA